MWVCKWIHHATNIKYLNLLDLFCPCYGEKELHMKHKIVWLHVRELSFDPLKTGISLFIHLGVYAAN